MDRNPIIQIRDMCKTFPGVQALKGVNLDLYPGEVHALVGENGAGKSTLIKIISGVHDFTEGEYKINGQDADIKKTSDAIEKGISVIYQELNLVSSLSIAENVFFGRLPQKKGIVQWKALYEETQKYMEMVGLHVSPKMKLQYLSVAQQQLVEIVKSVSLNSKVIIMDEPTSALSPNEIQNLFRVMEGLKKQGVAILYVSHKLGEIFAISDRISIFRDGIHIDTVNTGDIDEQQLIEKMVGRKVSDMFPQKEAQFGEKILEVDKLSTEKVHGLSFYVKSGEIVGFSGLMGAGRTEMAMGVFGVDKRLEGSVKIAGKEVARNSPFAAREAGMGLVVEDRKQGGIFPQLSVKTNMTLVSLKQVVKGFAIQGKKEKNDVQKMVDQLLIKTPNMKQYISKLSGGNQQKVLLARWLMKENLKLLIIDEPTRGIDVGAKAEIYHLIHKLAKQGLAILVVSSEMTEILGMCNRIYVMKDGEITAEVDAKEATETLLLDKAIH